MWYKTIEKVPEDGQVVESLCYTLSDILIHLVVYKKSYFRQTKNGLVSEPSTWKLLSGGSLVSTPNFWREIDLPEDVMFLIKENNGSIKKSS